MTTAIDQAFLEIEALQTQVAALQVSALSIQFRQTALSPTLADGVITSFPIPALDTFGNPLNIVIGKTVGTAGTGGGTSGTFTLVNTIGGTGNQFQISGTPGAYVATFSSAPSEIAPATPSNLYFDLSTPIA